MTVGEILKSTYRVTKATVYVDFKSDTPSGGRCMKRKQPAGCLKMLPRVGGTGLLPPHTCRC